MKKSILFLFFTLLTHLFTYAQIVNELVDFNTYVSPTNNDFVNRFNNGLGLTQITTNGITGGCLSVPATMNWGNDNAIYCSKYIGDSVSYCRTSVSFKYDTSVFNSSGFDRAVSIFLRPQSDFNHYVIGSISHSHTIELLTYSWTNSPGPPLNLTHNHWYEFALRVTFTGGPGYQIDLNALVTDLGTTGLGPPTPVNSAIGTFNDSILFGDTAIEVSLTATANGAARYLDNFKFEGIKSADSCITVPTYIPEKSPVDFSAFISGNELVIQNAPAESVVEIYSASGQLMSTLRLSNHLASLDISGWVRGIYFVRVKTTRSASAKKIAIMH